MFRAVMTEGVLTFGGRSYCCIRYTRKHCGCLFLTHASRNRRHFMFVTIVERVVCAGHFFRLWAEGGTLQRPDGKICQANRAEIPLLWLMTFCRIHAENMKDNAAYPLPEPFFFSLLSVLFPSYLDKAYKLQCTKTNSLNSAQASAGA